MQQSGALRQAGTRERGNLSTNSAGTSFAIWRSMQTLSVGQDKEIKLTERQWKAAQRAARRAIREDPSLDSLTEVVSEAAQIPVEYGIYLVRALT